MTYGELFTLLGLGGVFIIIGLGGIFWGRHEEKGYYDSMSKRDDLREFVAHWPERPQPKALKTGGWIAIAVGLAVIAVDIIRWLVKGPLP